MKKAAIGAMLVALLGAAAGVYCKPDLREDSGPGPALVVTQPPVHANASDPFWAGDLAGHEG